jgi:hypothetical protein
MRRNEVILGLGLLILSAQAANGGTIIQYDTQGVGPGSPTAAQIAAINPALGVTGIAVTRGSGLTPVSASFSLNSSGWDDLAADDYYEFGFSTTIPYFVDVFTVGLRSSNSGPGFVNLLYSKDGGSFMSLTSVNPIQLVGTLFNNLVIDLSEIGLVHSSLIFRLMVDPDNPTNALFNQDPSIANPSIGASGTFRFASYSPAPGVFLNPEITGRAIPEPSSVILAGIGIVAIVSLRRRGCVARAA